MRIPLDRLLLKPAVSVGMSPFVLLSLAHMFRTTTDDADPITVRAEATTTASSTGDIATSRP